MADVKFAVTNFNLSTAAAGTEYNIPAPVGFGTPKAAIFLLSRARSAGAELGTYVPSYGFTDGVNQYATSLSFAGSGVTADVNSNNYSNSVVALVSSQTTVGPIARHSFVRWTTQAGDGADGARLKADVPNIFAAVNICSVIWIGGDDVAEVFAGNISLGTGTAPIPITAPNFEPDLVFGVNVNRTGFNGTSAQGNQNMSVGMAINDGGQTQRSKVTSFRDTSTELEVSAVVYDDAISGINSTSATLFKTVLNSFDAAGFTLQNSASGLNSFFSYLAIRFTNSPDVSLFTTTVPTGSNYTEAAPNFEPSFGWVETVAGPSTINVFENGVNALVSDTSSMFDASSVWSRTSSAPWNIAVMDAFDIHDSSFRALLQTGGSNLYLASGYSFTSTGWDFPLTTSPSAPVLGWGFAIGPGAAANFDDSDAFTVTIAAGGPTIDTQPVSDTVTEPDPGIFNVFATASSGGGTLHYQWKDDGGNVGTDISTYNTGATASAMSGSVITVVVSDDNGSTTSDGASTLTVNSATYTGSSDSTFDPTYSASGTGTFSEAGVPVEFNGSYSNKAGNVGIPFTFDATVGFTGSFTPFTYGTGGGLPWNGLDIDPNTGVISGTPITAGTAHSINVWARDTLYPTNPQAISNGFDINITEPSDFGGIWPGGVPILPLGGVQVTDGAGALTGITDVWIGDLHVWREGLILYDTGPTIDAGEFAAWDWHNSAGGPSSSFLNTNSTFDLFADAGSTLTYVYAWYTVPFDTVIGATYEVSAEMQNPTANPSPDDVWGVGWVTNPGVDEPNGEFSQVSGQTTGVSTFQFIASDISTYLAIYVGFSPGGVQSFGAEFINVKFTRV